MIRFVIDASRPQLILNEVVRWHRRMAELHRVRAERLAKVPRRKKESLVEFGCSVTHEQSAEFWGNVSVVASSEEEGESGEEMSSGSGDTQKKQEPSS